MAKLLTAEHIGRHIAGLGGLTGPAPLAAPSATCANPGEFINIRLGRLFVQISIWASRATIPAANYRPGGVQHVDVRL